MQLRRGPKLILLALLIVGAYYGYPYLIAGGYIPKKTEQRAVVPTKGTLPRATPPATEDVPLVTPPPPVRPVARPAGLLPIRIEHWSWNGNSALIAANGGPVTTPDSGIGRRGERVELILNNDTNQMKTNMLTFASALAGGEAVPQDGAACITVMGDQTGAEFAGLNPRLRELCPDCTAATIAIIGRSLGEDQFMVKPEVKRACSAGAAKGACRDALKGIVVSGVIREGDWNIVLQLASDMEIPNNPDETTYDPEAINWMNAATFVEAGEAYINGKCESRPVVGGILSKTVCVDAVTTWTPVDVTIAREKGGLVRLVSTKQYDWMMPTTLLCVKRFVDRNRERFLKILEATYEAGHAIKTDPTAKRRAHELAAVAFQEADADYWQRYYDGTVEADKEGNQVELGGSGVHNLAEAALWFGLLPGTRDLYEATYKRFGQIVVEQYPNLVPSVPEYRTIVDRTLVRDLLQKAQANQEQLAPPQIQAIPASTPVKTQIGDKSWTIQFATGKATFTPEAEATLEELLLHVLPLGGVIIEINGHTDNTGTAGGNQKLSQARAEAVKAWLQQKAPALFSSGRVRALGHGQTEPLVPNDSAANMAKNRRVQVKLGVAS